MRCVLSGEFFEAVICAGMRRHGGDELVGKRTAREHRHERHEQRDHSVEVFEEKVHPEPPHDDGGVLPHGLGRDLRLALDQLSVALIVGPETHQVCPVRRSGNA